MTRDKAASSAEEAVMQPVQPATRNVTENEHLALKKALLKSGRVIKTPVDKDKVLRQTLEVLQFAQDGNAAWTFFLPEAISAIREVLMSHPDDPIVDMVPLADYKKLQKLVARQGIRPMDCESFPDQEPAPCVVAWPESAVGIRDFIGSNFCSTEYWCGNEAEPDDNDKYLVTAHDLLSSFRDWTEDHTPPQLPALTDLQQIEEALRNHGLALVKAAPGYAVLKQDHVAAHDVEAIDAIKALDQPDVEPDMDPVAWRMFDGEGAFNFVEDLPDDKSIAWSARYGRKWEPLYTLEKRQWAGLTDRELYAEADKEEQSNGFIQGAYWAEDKLKKNNT